MALIPFPWLSVVGASWQLASGHWVPAKMSMRLVHPRTSTTSTYIYENWYTGMALNLPVCVQGGAWPFYYELTTAPSGMAIGQQYGSANYGRITWASPTAGSHSVAVRVTDQDGNIVTYSWTLTVGTSKHVFFDAVNGNDANSGTFASPYQTFAKFSGLATTPELSGKICVYRSGTYATDNAAALTDSGYRWMMGPNKPLVHMAYPGDAVIFDFNECNWNWQTYSGTEVAIVGVEMRGINNAINASQGTYFRLDDSNRTLFDSINFTQQSGALTTPTNPACINFRDSGNSTDLAITNCTFDGLNNVFATELYDIQYVVFENNTLKNLILLGAFYAKLGEVYDITCRNNLATENNLTRIFIQDGYNFVNRMEICWNNMKTDSIQAVHYGQNPPGTDTIGWLYRNTIQVGAGDPAVRLHNVATAVTMENNVFVQDGTYTNGIRQTSYTGVLTQTDQLSTALTAYTDSAGALTGVYRTSYLGTHGWEVA